MRVPLFLLKCFGKAAANFLGGGIAGDVLFDVLPEVAEGAWEWWHRESPTPQQRRADLEAVAQASAAEVRLAVHSLALELAGDRPAGTQQALELYLSQIPAQVRKSLRRPADPTGTTAPFDRVPGQPHDLIPLLPARLPRFKPGDRPLPGVDWELEELLGVGGFGEVWKAKNPHLSSVPPVALKFCLEQSAAAFLRNEAVVLDRVMRQGRHPGIVTLERTYLSAETPCLEYEYVGGGDLAGLVHEWHRGEVRPGVEVISATLGDLARTVAHAHGQNPPIVHRDLKPANVLRQPAPDGSTQLKVADFGIGGLATRQAVQQATRGTSRGMFLGTALHGSCTPLYASPQQMRGEPPDPRDDVYSLGVIWFQMLTGDLTAGRPGGARWQRRLAELGLHRELVDLLAECFEDDPADRVNDAGALADRLGALLRSGGALLVDPTPPKTEHSSPLTPPPATVILQPAPATREEARIGSPPAPQSSKASEHHNRGESQRARGELDSAIASCSEAIRLDPNHHWAYGTRGAALSQKGEHDRALADLDAALSLSPDYVWAYAVRGETYRLKGDFHRAVADCTEAIRREPRNARAWWTRGESYRLLENYDRAAADCTEAIRLDPTLASAYATRGAAQRMKGDHTQAIADCSEAIRLDPGNVLAWYNRAESYRMKNDHDRAISDCDEVIRLEPGHSWAYGTRGASYRAKGQYDRALADLDETLRLNPAYAWAFAVRGETHRLKGDFAAAIADCTEAIRLDPRSSLAHATRGAAFRQRGDFATATADLNEALRLSPNYQWARDQLDLARRRRR